MKENIRKIIREAIDKILIKERITSKELEESGNFLYNELIEFESEIVSSNWKKLNKVDGFEYSDFIVYNSNDLFFTDVQIEFRFIKLSNNFKATEEELLRNNHGYFDDKFMRIKNGKAIGGRIYLNFAYYDGNFKNTITKNLTKHEMEHYYEHYKRELNNGDKSFAYMANVTNVAKEKILNNESNQFLNNLSFLMYCSLYFERNANLSTLYGELMNMPGGSLKEIDNDFKISKIYKFYYQYLENPQKIFNKEIFLKDEVDLTVINKYINDSIDDLEDKRNVLNAFFYKGNGVDNYIKKVYKIIEKSKYKFDKKLEYTFKKVLFDKKNQFGNLNENLNFLNKFKKQDFS